MSDSLSRIPKWEDLPHQAPEYDLAQLLEAGCHFGHHRSKRHPRMNEWVFTEKDGVHIFDLAKTAAQLSYAYDLAYQLGSQGKTMLVVGTKRQASLVIDQLVKEKPFNYIISRWLGGLLTNWGQVSKSLKRMLKIQQGLEKDEFKGYTKYEVVQMEKEMNRLKRFFIGLADLKNKPDFLFVIDPKREKIAIKEAQAVGIPVIALIDSNTDPEGIDLVIPANDDAYKSLQLIITEVVRGFHEGVANATKSH